MEVTREQLATQHNHRRPAKARKFIAVALRHYTGKSRTLWEIGKLIGIRDTGAHRACSRGRELLESGDQDALLDFYRGLARARQIGGY